MGSFQLSVISISSGKPKQLAMNVTWLLVAIFMMLQVLQGTAERMPTCREGCRRVCQGNSHAPRRSCISRCMERWKPLCPVWSITKFSEEGNLIFGPIFKNLQIVC